MIYKDFEMRLLKPENENYEDILSQALEICDEYLGKGLYSKREIDDICHSNKQYFYYVNKGDELVGIFCCYLALYEDVDFLQEIQIEGINTDDTVGICRSIAIKDKERQAGLSAYMLNYCTDKLLNQECAKAAFLVAWVKDAYIPAKRHLEECEYTEVALVEHPWYDVEGLVCPFCGQEHCICDGIVYMKR